MTLYILMDDDRPVCITTDMDVAKRHSDTHATAWSHALDCPDHLILDVVRDRPPTRLDANAFGDLLAFCYHDGWIAVDQDTAASNWLKIHAWAKLPEGGV